MITLVRVVGSRQAAGMRRWVVVAIAALLLVPSDRAVAVPAGPALPGAPAGGYRWPVAGTPEVTRPFDPPPRPWLPGHRGVDLAAAPGALVLAAGPGVVAFAGSVAGTGVVSIDHTGELASADEAPLRQAARLENADQAPLRQATRLENADQAPLRQATRLRTTYEPVTPLVPAGARVTAGQPIGILLSGHDGCPVSACLHWGLRRGAEYLDPLLLLGAVRMRLYPVDARAGDPPGRAPLAGGPAAPSIVAGGQTRASRPGSSAASRSYSSARL